MKLSSGSWPRRQRSFTKQVRSSSTKLSGKASTSPVCLALPLDILPAALVLQRHTLHVRTLRQQAGASISAHLTLGVRRSVPPEGNVTDHTAADLRKHGSRVRIAGLYYPD